MKVSHEKELPQGWKLERIAGHIAEFRSGIARGTKSRSEGYPHLRMNNISNDQRLNLRELWRIPASQEEVEAFHLEDDDILFNNTNSKELVGKCCLFRTNSDETFLFSNHVTRIRTKETLVPAYLVLWINSLWQRRFFRDNCDVWVNQAAVRVEDLLFPGDIPLPPKTTDQKRIAENLEMKMSEIDKMRVTAESQLQAISAMPGAVLRDMFDFERSFNR